MRPKNPLTTYGREIQAFCDDNLITCRELAKKAGISKSTLSDMMRGHYHGKEDTRFAVHKAMVLLGKRPDSIAK